MKYGGVCCVMRPPAGRVPRWIASPCGLRALVGCVSLWAAVPSGLRPPVGCVCVPPVGCVLLWARSSGCVPPWAVPCFLALNSYYLFLISEIIDQQNVLSKAKQTATHEQTKYASSHLPDKLAWWKQCRIFLK